MVSLIGPDVFTDVEMFRGYDQNNDTVYSHLLEFKYSDESMNMIKKRLNCPLHDTNKLNEFSTELQHYEHIIDARETELNSLRVFISNSQHLRDSIFAHNPGDTIIDPDEFVFFKMFVLVKAGLNKSSTSLTLNNAFNILGSPVISILTPILYFVLPYLVVRFRLKIMIPFKTYISIIFRSMTSIPIKTRTGITVQIVSSLVSIGLYLHGVHTTMMLSKNAYRVCVDLVRRIDNFTRYLNRCKLILSLVEPGFTIPIVVEKWICLNLSVHGEESGSQKSDKFYLKWISLFGSKLVLFKSHSIDDFGDFFEKFDMVCSKLSILHLKRKLNMCYSQFIESPTPTLNIKDGFHIMIKKPVTNSVKLVGTNLILTGPNAGGKSTFIKSVILNVLFSQTLCIACASVCEITPFYFINSQINIPDSKGVESLFEAEMSRCKYNLEILKFLKDSKSLIVMDELFNSTNVVEGISGAYSILSKHATYDNAMTLITTHYPYLTRVPKYIKYKMDALVGKEGQIEYMYKLKRGTSSQYIALDILKNNGFEKEIIDHAKEIQNKILV